MGAGKSEEKPAYAPKSILPAVLDLMKYPVIAITVILSLMAMEGAFDMDFSRIKKIGTDGVEFSEEERAALTAFEVRLKSIEDKLTASPAGSDTGAGIGKKEDAKAVADAQTVSPQAAVLTNIVVDPRDPGDEKIGYIFIGNERDGIKSSMLIGNASDGSPIALALGKLAPGSEYKVLANIVLRRDMPLNSEAYYKASMPLGTIPNGSKIRLESAPEAIEREFAMQYWARVKMLR